MLNSLAYADARDTTLSTMHVLLYSIFSIAGVVVLAAVPVVEALRRAHRFAGVIIVVTLFWALVACGSAYATISAQDQWSREETVLLDSGYYDPRDHRHDQPGYPWGLWIVLGAVYGGMLIWTFTAAAPLTQAPPSSES